jgi:hypothetical protein
MQDTFTLQNGTNREWTTTEEADLIYYGIETPGIEVLVEEDYAVVMTGPGHKHVCVWAIGDNLYTATLYGRKGASNKIYWSNSLRDCCDFAAEAVLLG